MIRTHQRAVGLLLVPGENTPDRTQVDRVYQRSPKHEDPDRHISHYGNFRLSPVTGQTGLRILLTQWQQASNSVVLDGAQ